MNVWALFVQNQVVGGPEPRGCSLPAPTSTLFFLSLLLSVFFPSPLSLYYLFLLSCLHLPSLLPSFHPISRHLWSPAGVPGAGTQVRSLSLCPCAGRARPTPASWRPCSRQGPGSQEGGGGGRGGSLQGREGCSVSPQARGPKVQSPFQRSFHLE